MAPSVANINNALIPESPSERSPLLLSRATENTSIQVEADAFGDAQKITRGYINDNYGDYDNVNATTELNQLLALAYPVMLTTALEFLPGFTSTIQAGHLHSPYTKEYVAAATLSTMFTNITGYSIGFGLASALDTLCSQAFGAQRFEKIGVYFQSGLLVIGCGLVPVLVLNWFTGDFLLLLGQDAQIAAFAQVFARYNLVGIPFVFLYELVRKTLQAQGIMAPLIGIAVLGNIVQIATGYWLAYHTTWGFAGVAASRSIGNVSMPLLLWVYFQYKPRHLSQWWCGWDLGAAVEHVGVFLSLGVPGMLMLVMEWWAFEVMTIMSGFLPDPAVAMAAQSVVVNIVNLLIVFFMGLSVAASIRVGNHLGAKLARRAEAVQWIAIKVAAVIGLVAGLGAVLARSWIPLLFVNDPVAVAHTANVLLVWAPFEISEGLNCVMQGIFRSAGMPDMAARTNAVTFYAVGMPLAYLLAFHVGWGVEGLWLGMGLSLTLSAALLITTSSRWNWYALADAAQERTAE